jgi:hypothetical protein
MFTNGSTATEGAGAAGGAGVRLDRVKCQATAGTSARAATPATASASRRPLRPSGRRGSVRSTPEEDTSNTQASTRATGKPAARAMTTKESVHSGSRSP